MPRSRFPIPSWPIGTSGSASWPTWTRREPRAQGHQRARIACHEGAERADRVPHLLRRPVRAVAGRERGGHPARRRLRERGAGRRGEHALGDARTDDLPHERSEEHTSELQSLAYLVCRLLLEKKKKKKNNNCISRREERRKSR